MRREWISEAVTCSKKVWFFKPKGRVRVVDNTHTGDPSSFTLYYSHCTGSPLPGHYITSHTLFPNHSFQERVSSTHFPSFRILQSLINFFEEKKKKNAVVLNKLMKLLMASSLAWMWPTIKSSSLWRNVFFYCYCWAPVWCLIILYRGIQIL